MLSSVKAHEHDARGLLSILSSPGAAGCSLRCTLQHAAGRRLLHACSKTWHLQQPAAGYAEAERLCRCTTMLQLIVATYAVQLAQ